MLWLWYASIALLVCLAVLAWWYRWWRQSTISSYDISYIDGAVYIPVMDADGVIQTMRYRGDTISFTPDSINHEPH